MEGGTGSTSLPTCESPWNLPKFLVPDCKNQRQIIKSIIQNQECIKSPFEKGGFRGISRGYLKSPLTPL
jgi:hypothetical protein